MAFGNRKRGFRNRVYDNMKLFLDDLFISRGYFDTVASGETNYEGTNQSQLLPVQNDPLYPVDTGSTIHVWQGYRKNWVSESGVQQVWADSSEPVLASGVYINGTFFPTADFDGTNGLAIDRRNGRVIVESGLPFGSTVEVEHSYKEVWVDTISRDMVTNQITAIDNTKRVIINNAPSGEIGQLPMVLMEIKRNPSPGGLQLGGGIVYRPIVDLHIVANSRYDKDEILDTLMLRTFETVKMVDMDAVSGQFTYYGNYASTYQTYSQLKTNHLDRNAFVKGMTLVANNDIAEDGYYTALVRMELRIDIPEEV